MIVETGSSIKVWRGYHSEELLQHLRTSWFEEQLLIVCAPSVTDFSFLKKIEQHKFSDKPILGVFTSGTSKGEPTLVLYSKKNIEASLNEILKLFNVSKIKTIFSYAQPFHTFGLLLGYILSIKLEAKLVTPLGKYSRVSHERRLACGERDLLTLGTPTHFADLLTFVEETGKRALPSYSCIIGGAPVTVALWKKVKDQLNIESPSIGYGCTEASPGITHLKPGVEPRFDGEIGSPLSNLNSKVLPDGIEISGPSLCLATISSSGFDTSAKGFIRDRVRIENGTWVFEGRTDLVINRGGEKFYLENIERLIQSEIGLSAIAVGLKDSRLGEDLGILVQADESKNSEEILKVVKSKVGINLAHLKTVSQLPLTANGKFDRKRAATMFEELKFPVATSTLYKWLPHRPPMVWVDEVTELTPQGGIAKVKLEGSKLYFTDGHVRQTALLEFLAQAYGYVSICKSFDHLSQSANENMKAYLAAMSGVEFSCEANDPALTTGKELKVEILGSKPVGPIQIVEGRVSTSDGRKLMAATMKVFSQ